MTPEIGWHFPPTGGGQESGWRDPGLAHFRGSPIKSLARETIQNSLDARYDPNSPVHVSFELHSLSRRDVPALDELRSAFTACLTETGNEQTAKDELNQALHLLDNDEILFLRVADWNTTGLQEDKWQALVKSQGITVKDTSTAGGSHGAGKFAPYAISPLRTVFYWTHAHTDDDSPAERFQGRALLMTHDATRQGERRRTQAVGYYGVVEGCRELYARGVPKRIQRVEHGGDRGCGTSLWIAGFPSRDHWRRELAGTVIESFYPAIARGDLTITLDDDAHHHKFGQGLPNEIDITASNLEVWFDSLTQPEHDPDQDEVDITPLQFARECWDLMQSGVEPEVVSDSAFGECRVWVRYSPGLPQQISVVRATGMVITTQQAGLRLRRVDDFAAVCVFDSPNGNELLRRMENPKHDQFEVDWLPEEERPSANTALKRMLLKIRKVVRSAAPEPPVTEVMELPELAKLLPDLNPGEEGLGKIIGPTKPPKEPPVPTPNRTKIGYVELRAQRVQTIAPRRVQIAFTPAENAHAKIELEEVGDADSIVRKVDAYDLSGERIALGSFQLKADKRVTFRFVGDNDVTQRAWRATARKLDNLGNT